MEVEVSRGITPDDLFGFADIVFRGTVRSVEARREVPEEQLDKPGGPEVMTFVALEPKTWFKESDTDTNPEEVILRIPGGEVGTVDCIIGVFATVVGGTPFFELKEDVIVFLTAIEGASCFRMTYGQTSKYLIKHSRVYSYPHRRKPSVPLHRFLRRLKKLAQKEE
jgi:hypothetical protein